MKNLFLVVVILTITFSSDAAFYGNIETFGTTGFPGQATPENTQSSLNIMSYVVSRHDIVPPTNIEVDTSALNPLQFVRSGNLISSTKTSYLGLWDATNSNLFPQAAGQRLARVLDLSNSIPFAITSVFYRVWSSDPQNTLQFQGQLGAGSITHFNQTFRGEVWENGLLVKALQGGQDARTQMVNRVVFLLRYGYVATNDSRRIGTLNFYAGHIAQGGWTNTIAFFVREQANQIVYGVTNAIRNMHGVAAAGTNIIVRGERVGFTYTVEGTTNLTHPVTWQQVTNGVSDGYTFPATSFGMRFFRTRQDITPAIADQTKSLAIVAKEYAPDVHIE